MKILVTGGTVFVSKFIAEYFTVKGNEVYVLNRNTKPQLSGVKLIECDRRAIGGRLKGLHFDVVIDVNAYTPEDVNNLLVELESYDNYILISSSAVYPETLVLPFKENDKCGKNKFWGAYGLNKISAEKVLFDRGKNFYILRPPYLYGEYNNIYREAFVFDCAEMDKPFYLPQEGTMKLQFFHVEDLCKFIELIIKILPEQKIFNVGSNPITVKNWVDLCYSVVGKVPTFINVPSDIEQKNYFPFYNYEYSLDITAQNLIMPEHLSLAIGLKRAYNWYKVNKDKVNVKDYFNYIQKNFQ